MDTGLVPPFSKVAWLGSCLVTFRIYLLLANINLLLNTSLPNKTSLTE